MPQAARSALRAARTELPSGTYFAPTFRQWGKPRVTVPLAKDRNPQDAAELWKRSAELTGCDWPIG
jgi:hypothetical protein